MSEISFGKEYLQEFESEVTATRKCLERISLELFDWKPHEKSMQMGYLTLLVAEMPKWISSIIVDSEIDLATYKHDQPKTTEELVAFFDENVKKAKEALGNVTNKQLEEENFSLKANGQLLYSSPKKANIYSTINHWVHHRGQLTVYMRLNDIAVPSIYGPSADDKSFDAPK